tara:strand:- start:566 stop:871 length:306 start_codon:yes stop_codon:yes gene_type:complete
MDGIIKLVISISVLFAILIVGLTTSVGLHAKPFLIDKPEIYDCVLDMIHEYENEKYPEMFTCVYICEDPNDYFEWIERTFDEKGCKIHSTIYKTKYQIDKL